MPRRVVKKNGALCIGAVHDNADSRVAYFHGGEVMPKGTEVWFHGGRWYGADERMMLYAGEYNGKMIGYAEPPRNK